MWVGGRASFISTLGSMIKLTHRLHTDPHPLWSPAAVSERSLPLATQQCRFSLLCHPSQSSPPVWACQRGPAVSKLVQ